jgi:hypothetical protein
MPFDPSKSRVSAAGLGTYLQNPVSEDVKTIPGIGPASAEKLRAEGFENSYKVMGQFLKLRECDMTSQEHCDAFWAWLTEMGMVIFLNRE